MRFTSLAAAAALLAGASAVPQVVNAKVTNTLTTTFTKTLKQTDKTLITVTQTITKTKLQPTTAYPTITVTAPASPVPTVTESTSTIIEVSTLPPSTIIVSYTVTAPVVTSTVTAAGPTVTLACSSSISVTSGTTATIGTTATTTSSTTMPPVLAACPTIVTAYTDIPAAVAACTAITLSNIDVPGNSSIVLSKLKPNTHVTFAGRTFFEYSAAAVNALDLITVGGVNLTIDGAPGHIIDGNGPAWWDGLGSNGGVQKPNHFFVGSKITGMSFIQNLNIKNWPVHCFSISNCVGLTFQNINLDNSDGYAPNNRSNGLPAAHNSDGFDLSGCNNTSILNSTVVNQDDCVAITSGNVNLVSGLQCSGSHGLSIGSVGGKSNNNVTNIVFQDSTCTNCENGARIKSNYNTTGFISNITYQNIYLSNITTYGIDIQSDYLNGGPTGIPSNGVIISNIFMTNITGTAASTAADYYILCGAGSCSNFVWNDIDVSGGGQPSMCNFQTTGDFTCDGMFNVTSTPAS